MAETMRLVSGLDAVAVSSSSETTILSTSGEGVSSGGGSVAGDGGSGRALGSGIWKEMCAMSSSGIRCAAGRACGCLGSL